MSKKEKTPEERLYEAIFLSGENANFHGKPNPDKLELYYSVKEIALMLKKNCEEIKKVWFSEPCETEKDAFVYIDFELLTFFDDKIKDSFVYLLGIADDITIAKNRLSLGIFDTYIED